MHSASDFQSEIPVVLTATIIPNAASAAAINPEERLADYRAVVQFCKQFAPVYFLENSTYPLEKHPEFADSNTLRVRRFAPSKNPERGKGYQEFEMLDAWLAAESQPPARWLKITGRYQLLNLPAILAECRQDQNQPLLIDQIYRQQWSRSYLFCVQSSFYQAQMKGLYRECDDRNGDYHFIERVLFRHLAQLPAGQAKLFKTQPRIQGISGTTGIAYPSGRFQWLVKQGLRSLNRMVNQRQLLYTRSR
jgi:hypothetical protein